MGVVAGDRRFFPSPRAGEGQPNATRVGQRPLPASDPGLPHALGDDRHQGHTRGAGGGGIMPYRVASAEECPALAALFAQLWPRHKRWTVSVLVQNAPAVAFWRAMGYTDYELTLATMPQA
jgi:hypothetical protein